MSELFIEMSAATYRGKKREANEDAAFCFQPAAAPPGASRTLAVIGAAGGMGGAGAGDAASAAARAFIESVFMKGGEAEFARGHGIDPEDYPALLGEAFNECNRSILRAAEASRKAGVMGTTLALGVIVYNARDEKTYLHVGNVGNCRGYIIRGEQIFHATEEDSVAWRLYKKGAITYSELLQHPLRSQITVMGIDTPISPEVHSIELRAADIVLFCTDGVHEAVSDPEIDRVIRKYADAKRACDHLLDAARAARAGKDNAAAAMAYCFGAPVAAARRFALSATHIGSRSAKAPALRRMATIAVWSLVCILAAAALAVYLYQPSVVQSVRGFFSRPVTNQAPAVVSERAEQKDSVSIGPPALAARPDPVSERQRTPRVRSDVKSEPQRETVRPIPKTEKRRDVAAAASPGAASSRPAAPPETVSPSVSVEWNAETERFRIKTSHAGAVPTRLRYGSHVFDVVPVKSMPNLYRTTTPLKPSMISKAKVVHVTMSHGGLPVVVTFTEIK